MEKTIDLLEHIEITRPGEVYNVLDINAQCMGDITYFWDGMEDFTEKCKYVLMGVPEDKPIIEMGGPEGAYEGPNAFRREFYRLSNYFQKPEGLIADIGNVRIDLDSDASSTHKKVSGIISFLAKKDILPIIIGGGSDVTYASVRGLKESGQFEKLGLVSFDAHLDLLDVPDRFVAGSAMKRIMDEFPEFIPQRNIFFFGARKEAISPNIAAFIEKNKIQVCYKDTIIDLKKDLIFALNTSANAMDGLIFSIDMDSCDAGMMPGTSFPMPGGFKPDEIILIAQSLSKYKLAVYLDIVELNPRMDTNNITSVMAALLVFHFLEKK